MSESDYQELREIGWQRKLTADEEARLQSFLLIHPELAQDWEEEAALNQILEQLPSPPVSSNFTARVLQSIDLEEAQAERATRKTFQFPSWLRALAPRAVLAALLLSLGGLAYVRYDQHQVELAQENMARGGKQVALVATTLPDMQMWQDFETIRRLNVSLPAASDDESLLAALK